MSAVLNVKSILLILSGVALGLIFGSIPGLTATMGMAIVLPMTFGMSPMEGMALLMGLYIGGISGGMVPAILLKLPGTPSSIATTFDGYPMAQKGQAGQAFGYAIVFSFLGGLLSIVILMLLAPPLAQVALQFGPYEYFAVTVFALTMISSLAGDSLVKGMLSGLLGMTMALVGSAPIDAFPRFTFGYDALDAGFNLLPVLIGLFAVSEMIRVSEQKIGQGQSVRHTMKGFGFTLRDFFKQGRNWFRSSLFGTGIGILPGIGAGTANIIAYVTAKNKSKHPQEFGKGTPDGVVASESANNAAVGGALVPLISLGIPGDTVTALLLGGLMIHGLTPGPLLFENNGDIVYGIFIALIIANFAMIAFLYWGMRWFTRVLSIPQYILLPVILVLCVVGAIGVNNRIFDAGALLFFGLLGYIMIKFRFPIAPVILGFILGPLLETNLRRGLMYSQGDFTPFFTEPIAATFLALALISVVVKVSNIFRNKNKSGPKGINTGV
nr:tripartite tricarboxylate transporter permease [Caldalkalibacillus salinus]